MSLLQLAARKYEQPTYHSPPLASQSSQSTMHAQQSACRYVLSHTNHLQILFIGAHALLQPPILFHSRLHFSSFVGYIRCSCNTVRKLRNLNSVRGNMSDQLSGTGNPARLTKLCMLYRITNVCSGPEDKPDSISTNSQSPSSSHPPS